MKFRSSLAACLILAFVSMVAVASAKETYWDIEQVPIPIGESVAVSGIGSKMKVGLKNGKRNVFKAACSIEGSTAMMNDFEHGIGEVTKLNFSCADGVTVKPLPSQSGSLENLAWQQELTYPSWPLHIEWSGVRLEVSQNEIDYGIFEGTLQSQIGDADSQGVIGSAHEDDVDNTDKFKANGESLQGPANGYLLSITGGYKLGQKNDDRVTGEIPGGFEFSGPGGENETEESAILSYAAKQHERTAKARAVEGNDEDIDGDD